MLKRRLVIIISVLLAIAAITTAIIIFVTSDNKQSSPSASATQSAQSAETNITFNDGTFSFDGKAHSIYATDIPSDATAVYSNNDQINVGEYTVTVTVSKDGNAIATKTAKLTITAIEMQTTDVVEIRNVVYSGNENVLEPVVAINGYTLIKDTDYTFTSVSNYDNLTATLTIVGTGRNFTGQKTVVVTIDPLSMDLQPVDVIMPAQTFSGEQLTPVDFTVKYKNYVTTFTIKGYGENVNAGNNAGYVDIEFNGNYTGGKRIYFNILQRNINSVSDLNLDAIVIPTQFYTGYELRPSVVLPVLTVNTDYTLAYSNNVEYCMDMTSVNAPTLTILGQGNYTGFFDIPFGIDENLVNKFDSENPNVLAYVFNSLVNNSQSINVAYSADMKLTYNQLLLAYQTLTMNYTATLNSLVQYVGAVNGNDYASVKNATIVLTKALFSQLIQVPGVVIRYDVSYNDVDENNTSEFGRSYIGIAKSLGIDFFTSGYMYPDNDVTAKQFAYVLYNLNKSYGSYPMRNVTRSTSAKVVNKLNILPASPLNNTYRMIIENDTLSPLYNVNWDGALATPLVSFGNTLFHYQQILSCLQTYANMIYEFYDVEVTFSFSPVFSAYNSGNFQVRLFIQVGESSTPVSFEKLFGQDYSFDDNGTVKTYASTGTPWLDKISELKNVDNNKYNNYKKYAEVLTSTNFLMMPDGSTAVPEDVSSQSFFMELGLFNITAIASQGN